MIVRSKEYFNEDGSVPIAMLRSCIDEHRKGHNRRMMLRDYYSVKNRIMSRTRRDDLPNNRLAHAYPWYISTIATGYLIGKPVSYSDDTQPDVLGVVLDAYSKCSIESVDTELARDASIYGVGVELTYADEGAVPRCAALDPDTAFVVYDDTVRSLPMFGVHYVHTTDMMGISNGYRISVMTDTVVYVYQTDISMFSDQHPTEIIEHSFGAVPMTEYWNNEDEIGDFERIISLIDAYDVLQSDRINDKDQFIDAVLVLSGFIMEKDEDGRTPAQQLREDGVLAIPGENASAQWLAKQLDEADTEVLRESVNADIHKLSMVPDLTDEHFSSNTSGVAMRFKLFGLEQLTKLKERWYREGLRNRLNLFANFLYVQGKALLDVTSVQIVFSHSLPVNELETAQMVQALGGIVPEEMLIGQIPFVSDVQKAVEMMAKEREEDARRQQAAFGFPVEQGER